jgi:hypothetical protein
MPVKTAFGCVWKGLKMLQHAIDVDADLDEDP